MGSSGVRRLTSTTGVALAGAFWVSGCVGNVEPRQAGSAGDRPTGHEPFASDDVAKSPWESCYSTFSPSGDPAADLQRLTTACGSTGGMKPITEIQTGQQTDQDPVDRFTLDVPDGGKCYRIYSAADGNVQDLDLLLRDPNGSDVAADLTHHSWPVLPAAEPACLKSAGQYMVEVSVHRGSGRYAMQVWGR